MVRLGGLRCQSQLLQSSLGAQNIEPFGLRLHHPPGLREILSRCTVELIGLAWIGRCESREAGKHIATLVWEVLGGEVPADTHANEAACKARHGDALSARARHGRALACYRRPGAREI
jgi:hypothetical protein